MSPSTFVRDYVDHSIAYLRQCDLLRRPHLPDAADEMLDLSVAPDENGVGWKPVPSTVSAADLDELEAELELRYPPSYRDFLRYQHFYELLGPLEFFPHPIAGWKTFLRQTYRNDFEPQRIVGRGLIPFADEVFSDAGFLCFDTRSAGSDGESPVVLWDREQVGTDRELRLLFSSSARMFEALLFDVDQEMPFMRMKVGEGEPRRNRKRELMAGFLAIDPEGAGGAGRAYWTAGGIDPEES